jgi:hypothetical protein
VTVAEAVAERVGIGDDTLAAVVDAIIEADYQGGVVGRRRFLIAEHGHVVANQLAYCENSRPPLLAGLAALMTKLSLRRGHRLKRWTRRAFRRAGTEGEQRPARQRQHLLPE